MDELEPPDSWRPLLLPRPDRGAEPAGVLTRCRGERALRSFDRCARAAIERARGDGLVALVPPPRPRGGEPMLVVSPHPDDAVLSLGAALAGAGGRVIDVFSRETWSPRPFYAARPQLAAAVILEEERTACRILGVEPVFLGFPDAPLRGLDPFDAGAPGEPLLLALADALRTPLAGDGPVYAPLGIGAHADHLACRLALGRLVADGSLAPQRLRFYEDLPYAALSREAGPAPAAGAEVRVADRVEALAKAQALRAYHVQLREGIRRRVLAHGAAIAGPGLLGERLWRLDDDAAEQAVADSGDPDDPCGRADAR